MVSFRLIFLSALMLACVSWTRPAYAIESRYDRRISGAQACLNRPNGRNTLRCIADINRYNTPIANTLKCAAHVMHNGFFVDFLQEAWIYDNGREYPLLSAVTFISDLDTSIEYAEEVKQICSNTYHKGKPLEPLLGEYLLLRARFLRLGDLDDEMLTRVENVRSVEIVEGIEKSLAEINKLCVAAKGGILDNTVLCLEPDRIRKLPGRSFFERMKERMRIYG